MAINITLKNLPSELHEELKSAALRHRRSLNSEIIALIEDGLRPRRRTAGETLASARAVRERIKNVWLTDAMINESKREGRR
jgi:plasmid stability protein